MGLGLLRRLGLARIILLCLAVTVATSPRDVRILGDRLQNALPTLAWGCAILNGKGSEYALRFTTMMILAHGSKHALGDAPINIRPDGGDLGFPSAHTSASVLGASSLVNDCIAAHPVAKGIVLISAGFVGGSRIESDRHDIWQVLAGALLGWTTDRAFRKEGRIRRALARPFAPLGRSFAWAAGWILGLFGQRRANRPPG